MKDINFKLVGISLGNIIKNTHSLNEINSIAKSIFDFNKKDFKNSDITSQRVQLVYDWIISLKEENSIDTNKKYELIKNFIHILIPEQSEDFIHKYLYRNEYLEKKLNGLIVDLKGFINYIKKVDDINSYTIDKYNNFIDEYINTTEDKSVLNYNPSKKDIIIKRNGSILSLNSKSEIRFKKDVLELESEVLLSKLENKLKEIKGRLLITYISNQNNNEDLIMIENKNQEEHRLPRIFIGCSTENLKPAYAIQKELEYNADALVWTQSFFKPSSNTLETLLSDLNNFDFAIFIFMPDDKSEVRGKNIETVRDNVLFELGLFMGKLGKDRVFFVTSQNSNVHIPTDLWGITPGSFNHKRSDGNYQAALGPFCSDVRDLIEKLGLINKKNNKK